MSGPLRPWAKPPYDDQHGEFFNWLTSALNQLIGQAQPPPSTGLQSLQNNSINPTTAQITSAGSRMSSVTTAITYVAGPTFANFYWDGSNNSQVLRIGRDDGTVYGPNPTGSPFAVAGLTPSTLYRFYPYFDEATSAVRFATNPATGIGTPAVGFTVPDFVAAQQQILRGHVPLGLLLVTTGLSTPGSGTTSGSGGTGGGGAGAGGNRGPLE